MLGDRDASKGDPVAAGDSSAAGTGSRVILAIEPGLGGGIARHVEDLEALMRGRAAFLRLAPNRGGLLKVTSFHVAGGGKHYFRMPHEFPALASFLRNCGVGRIHFHHTLRLGPRVLDLPAELGVPYDFTVHDYYSYCPQITLTGQDFQYCGEPDEVGCDACLRLRPTSTRESIRDWRERQRVFVEGAARVFVPAPSVGQAMRKHFPRARIILAPHPEAGVPVVPRNPPWPSHGRNLKVAVLGALNAIKGADLLEAAAQDAAARGLPLEFHLIGYAYRSLSTAAGRLAVHGKYRERDLPGLLDSLAPHVVWFPARWPETYSYTLSAAFGQGFPVAATNLGAIGDRLAGRALSWTLPWDASGRQWCDFFAALRSGPAAVERYRTPGEKVETGTFSYERDYLHGQPRATAPVAVAAGFDAYRSPLRAQPAVVFQYVKGYAQDVMRAAYRLPGIRTVAVRMFPEHRMQRLRRWLDRY